MAIQSHTVFPSPQDRAEVAHELCFLPNAGLALWRCQGFCWLGTATAKLKWSQRAYWTRLKKERNNWFVQVGLYEMAMVDW